ncbi:hypothetical protein D3C85_1599220 [compost metagenome]
MRQLAHGSGGNADFIGHAFDVPDRTADHFPRLHCLITSSLRSHGSITCVLRDLLHRQAHFVDGGGDHVGHFLLSA